MVGGCQVQSNYYNLFEVHPVTAGTLEHAQTLAGPSRAGIPSNYYQINYNPVHGNKSNFLKEI
jgi:hypothetical protein